MKKNETAEKTKSKKDEIVPVIYMFKLLPQAKFKLKKHIPPQSSPSISGKKNQKSLEKEKNKNKPKKSMANTGRQNPQQDLTFVFKNTESQYPLKRSSRKEKNNQAKGDSKMKKKCEIVEQKISWDKKNTPRSILKYDMFQRKIQLDIANMLPTQKQATEMPTQEATVTNTTTTVNQVASQLSMMHMETMPKQDKMKSKETTTYIKNKKATTMSTLSSDEELIEITEELEKVQTLSDDELLEAVQNMELENQENGAAHHEPSGEEDHHDDGSAASGVPHLTPPPRVMKNHLGRNQRWQERNVHKVEEEAEDHEHHVVDHHGQGIASEDDEGARTPSPDNLPTQGSQPRAIRTPLWKRARCQRRSSLSGSPRKAIRRIRATASQENNASQPANTTMNTSNNATMPPKPTNTMKTCPGSTKPRNRQLASEPYNPNNPVQQLANTPARPTIGRETGPMGE